MHEREKKKNVRQPILLLYKRAVTVIHDLLMNQ